MSAPVRNHASVDSQLLEPRIAVGPGVAPASLTVSAPPAPSASFVKRVGTQLVLDGRPYRFTGLNIYNANSRDNCWYSLGFDDGALDASLNAIGPAQNAFRAWFFQSLATRNGLRDWSAFDHTLAVAAAHHQRVVFTLANQWGSCEESPTPVYKDEEWYRSGYRTVVRSGTVSYRAWVAEVVARYRDDPTILMWQLMNEAENQVADQHPACGSPATLKAWADDMSGLIKAIDSNHLISLGTIGGGQCGAVWNDYETLHSSQNIDLCEYHDYGAAAAPLPGDEWNGLQVRIRQCRALNKPVFVGETGILLSEAGGSTLTRSLYIKAKLRAQLDLGVVGELLWAWNNEPVLLTTFDVGARDPALTVLSSISP